MLWDVPNPHNHEEYTQVLRAWAERRRAESWSPVRPGHELCFTAQPAFDFLPLPSYQVAHSSYLGQPLAPLDSTAEDAYAHPRRPYFDSLRLNSDSLPEFRVILNTSLSTGLAKFAQVWKAEVMCPNGPSLAVVVKIFQGSLFPQPQWLDRHRIIDQGTPLQEEVAHCEAWAYERLRPAQGTVVPYSYGFYLVELPCKDIVCAHIMEFVDGVSPATYSRSFGGYVNEEKTEKFLITIAKSVYTLHCLGVVHRDIGWWNILVPGLHPGACILIDFSSARSLEDCPPEERPALLVLDAALMKRVMSRLTTPRRRERWADSVRADPGNLWARPLRDYYQMSYEGIAPTVHGPDYESLPDDNVLEED